MNGQWIILLWALLGFVFLLKATPFRRLVSRMRRQPPAVQAAAALCLLVAVIVGGTKPGGTNAPSSSPRPAAAPAKNSSLLSPHSSLPSWWADDPTDTDGDGIPDLWEKWTHGNRHVADGDIDRDGDGLTDWQEFWNQTDPRTADTDGDGFDDAFEVAHGMDPIAQEDFTPVEPDENGNGVIDIWEGTSYLYGFTDADNNGFDDCYEAYHLEPASAGNYDVVVDVFTTRSAVLTWTATNETHGIVLPATTGTSARLRLPFKTDARIELLAEPEGATLPDGELWKARLEASFAPRDGQTAVGTCIVSDDGDIQQTVPKSTSAIMRFPVEAPSTQTPSSSGGGGFVIDVLEKRFEIVPPSAVYHSTGDDVGPFTVTNAVNIDTNAILWSTDCGTMSPGTGGASTLTVTSLPPDGDEIVVTASLMLDDVFRAVDTAIVDLCPGREFSITDCTSNFSPHLGETNVFDVTLPGCAHQNTPGWLEAEVMRQTTAGWDHIAYVDLDSESPGLDRWRETTSLSMGSNTFSWDGKAQVDLPLADHPDVFTGPKGSFNRAMPAMLKGEPVPPPFCTLFVRLWNPERETVLEERSRKIHVPQVVNIVPFGGEDVFQESVFGVGSNGVDQVLLYSGCEPSVADAAFAMLPAMAQEFFPSDVNLRIVATDSIQGPAKGLVIVSGSSDESRRGDAVGFRKRNAKPDGALAVYVAGFQESLKKNYKAVLAGNNDPMPVPMTPAQFARYIAPTIAHEIAHGCGLVDPDWLPAIDKGKNIYHNSPSTGRKMMDVGGLYFVGHRLDPDPIRYWLPDNLRYLRFILPTGE
ncbi:MAG: thrombospondin type 3 repeat-containing protein [Kiritimatiellia bacterium]